MISVSVSGIDLSSLATGAGSFIVLLSINHYFVLFGCINIEKYLIDGEGVGDDDDTNGSDFYGY